MFGEGRTSAPPNLTKPPMPRPGPDIPRYDTLRASKRTLARIAPWVRIGIFSVGFSLFLNEVRDLVHDVQFTWGERQIIGIVGLSYLAGFGLAGWIVGRLLSTGAELIDVFADQAESSARTANLLEEHALPALGRIALALEKLSTEDKVQPREPVEDETTRRFAVARQAIAANRWAQADKLVGALVREFPGPEAARLLAELEDARNRAVEALKTRLEAAKTAGDALLVVELRDALTEHLRGDRLDDFDRKLVRWLVGEIKQKIRTGTIKPELATLATRVADSFADTPEGAALKGSIPNLRRSAGLCPKCARPYKGADDACPRCQGRNASGANPTYVPLSGEPDDVL
jgi:hypothetical protein